METFVPGLHGQPHPSVNTTALGRVRAEDQPPSIQREFSKAYPFGLPAVYKMMRSTNSHGVVDTYVEDSLPVGFYTHPPSDAPAIFSTKNGTRPFSYLTHILPPRRLHLWSKDEIQERCNSLRKTYWNHMKTMKKLNSWDDLYTYFDACDLYHHGVQNLWNVVNTLFDENEIIRRDVSRESAQHIGEWVDKWLENIDNKTKLGNWTEKDGFIVYILSEEDRNDMDDLTDDMMPVVANALKCRRAFLLSSNFHKGRTQPNDILSAVKNSNFENWLGMCE